MTPLDYALAYHRAGWSIVPAATQGKRALVPWRAWQQTTPDPDQLHAWWRRRPRANLAIVTGRLSGVVVIDVDPRHHGDHALAELEQHHGDLPWTTVVETPSGGWHVYLAHPGDRVPNSSSRIGLGIDVRGDGGLALLPPSHRPDGAYRWAVGGPNTIPTMPAAWVDLLRPPPTQAGNGARTAPGATQHPRVGSQDPDDHHQHAARLAGILRALQRAPKGQRNCALYWAGCRLAEMVDRGAPPNWADELIRAGIAAGLQPSECRDTVASALARAQP